MHIGLIRYGRGSGGRKINFSPRIQDSNFYAYLIVLHVLSDP